MNIRVATLGDAYGIAKVHVDVWRTAYKGIMPDALLDDLSYDQRAAKRTELLEKTTSEHCCFVAESQDSEIVGFTVGGPSREDSGSFSGEIYAIYLLESEQGKGIGKQLLMRMAQWLLTQGHQSMLIWVLSENPTRKFYEAMGGEATTTKIVEFGGKPLEEISYGWSDLKAFLESH